MTGPRGVTDSHQLPDDNPLSDLDWAVISGAKSRRLATLWRASGVRIGNHRRGRAGAIRRSSDRSINHNHRVPPSAPVISHILNRASEEREVHRLSNPTIKRDAKLNPATLVLKRPGIDPKRTSLYGLFAPVADRRGDFHSENHSVAVVGFPSVRPHPDPRLENCPRVLNPKCHRRARMVDA